MARVLLGEQWGIASLSETSHLRCGLQGLTSRAPMNGCSRSQAAVPKALAAKLDVRVLDPMRRNCIVWYNAHTSIW